GLAAREPVGGAVRVGEQVEDPIDRGGDDAREGDGDGAHEGATTYKEVGERTMGVFPTATPQRRGAWCVVLDGASRAVGTAPQPTTHHSPRLTVLTGAPRH